MNILLVLFYLAAFFVMARCGGGGVRPQDVSEGDYIEHDEDMMNAEQFEALGAVGPNPSNTVDADGNPKLPKFYAEKESGEKLKSSSLAAKASLDENSSYVMVKTAIDALNPYDDDEDLDKPTEKQLQKIEQHQQTYHSPPNSPTNATTDNANHAETSNTNKSGNASPTKVNNKSIDAEELHKKLSELKSSEEKPVLKPRFMEYVDPSKLSDSAIRELTVQGHEADARYKLQKTLDHMLGERNFLSPLVDFTTKWNCESVQLSAEGKKNCVGWKKLREKCHQLVEAWRAAKQHAETEAKKQPKTPLKTNAREIETGLIKKLEYLPKFVYPGPPQENDPHDKKNGLGKNKDHQIHDLLNAMQMLKRVEEKVPKMFHIQLGKSYLKINWSMEEKNLVPAFEIVDEAKFDELINTKFGTKKEG